MIGYYQIQTTATSITGSTITISGAPTSQSACVFTASVPQAAAATAKLLLMGNQGGF
jgi:hypothetical protein